MHAITALIFLGTLLTLTSWTEALPGFFGGGWNHREAACPGEASQCVPLRRCAQAVRAITSGAARRLPRRCDFRGFVEFVCCDEDDDHHHHQDRDHHHAGEERGPAATTTEGSSDGPWVEPCTEEEGEKEATSITTSTERTRPRPTPKPTPTPTPTTPPTIQQTKDSPSERACQKYSEDAIDLSNTLELKIVNGEEAKEGEFPYMVAIGYASRFNADLSWNCGGTLISDRYVLTAAHCISDSVARNLTPVALRVGELRLGKGPRRADDLAVQASLLHPGYRPPLKYWDLALLRTDRPVAFSSSVRPACVSRSAAASATATASASDTTRLFAAGWGAVDAAGAMLSPNLMKVQLRQVSLEQCERLLGSQNPSTPRGIDDSMMCATGVRKGQDTCFGDSGGPLVERGNLVDTLVAVTSFGGNPCAGVRPGIYARVAPAIDWIENIVWS